MGMKIPHKPMQKKEKRVQEWGPEDLDLRDKQRKTFLEAKKVSRKVGDIERESCHQRQEKRPPRL